MFGGETVIVLTGTPILDAYSGLPTGTDWTTTPPAEAPVENVLCEPRPSSEPVQDARNAVTSGYTLYLTEGMPAGSTIGPTNRVRVRGIDYDVLGEPSDWRLGSWRPGLVVQTQRVAG
jgi:hypothetical protein